MGQKQARILFVLLTILIVALCIGTAFVTLGSSVTLWFALDRNSARPTPTVRLLRRAAVLETAIPTAASATATPTVQPTETAMPSPTPTATFATLIAPTFTPAPPTSTSFPPTATPVPTQAPPTATPLPTATPIPSYPFTILETGQFPTSHINFDVFIAVTSADNKPLAGYRVLAQHDSGLQEETEISAGDWTHNSGAMHYKAGNIKLSVLGSPGGVWVLQLVDEAGTPLAPQIEFPFDPSNPTWYFLLYRRLE